MKDNNNYKVDTDTNRDSEIPKTSIYGIQVSKLSLKETVQHLTNIIDSHKTSPVEPETEPPFRTPLWTQAEPETELPSETQAQLPPQTPVEPEPDPQAEASADRDKLQQPYHVVTANPIMIMTALDHPKHMSMMKRADLIVPDGTGLVWAAQYIGNPVTERVPGIELLHELMRIGEHRGWRVFLLGTSPETIEKTAHNLQKQYPKLIIAGYHDGFFDESQDQNVIAQIHEAHPHILLVGRSADNQDIWLDAHKQQLKVPFMMGIGGSFDVIAGTVKRAPALWQKIRLEWLYRLLREPRRFPRMLLLPKFVIRVIRDKKRAEQ